MKNSAYDHLLKWDRILWGVLFKSEKKDYTLIGGAWHKAMVADRYEGEPSRPILFEARKEARKWCQEMNEKYKEFPWPCNTWKFKPVRVRELITVEQKPKERREHGDES